MKTKHILFIALTAGLMSSCKVADNLYGKYHRPEGIKTANIYGEAENGEQSMADLSWRQVFTDPQLQQLIEQTLANNSDMKQAELSIKQASQGLSCAKTGYIPFLSFSPSGTLSKVIDFDPMPGYSKSYSLPIAASWQFPAMGNLFNQKRKAQVSLEQAKTGRQAIQTQLVAAVAKMYYTLAMLDESLAICEQTVKNWERNLDITKKLMDVGQSNLAGVSSTEANLYAIKTNIVELKNSRLQVENTLAALMGQTPGHINRGTLNTWQTPSIVTTGVPDSLLSRRPDVRLAELELASAVYDQKIAFSAFFPGLNLSGQLNWTNSLGGQVLDPAKWIVTGIGSITQPLFMGNINRKKYKIKKLEVEKATIKFQQAVIDAGSEVNTAMAAVQAAEAKRDLLKGQVAALQNSVRATESLWSLSSLNYLQILTAQTGLLSAQMNEVNNKMDIITNTITLYQALGGCKE